MHLPPPPLPAISEKLSFFRSQLENRRFNGGTLQILESVLVARDVHSLMEFRSALQELLRPVLMSVMQEIADKTVDQKLHTVEFFVRALALAGDVESCLALKYEAFTLRDTKHITDHSLQVSYKEWLTFAKDSLDNGYYSIAVKGFENALLCVQSNNNAGPDTLFVKESTIKNIKELRDTAEALITTHSVQAKSAEYLKRKATREVHNEDSCSSYPEHVASSMFRNGIRRRNMQKLIQSKGINRDFMGP